MNTHKKTVKNSSLAKPIIHCFKSRNYFIYLNQITSKFLTILCKFKRHDNKKSDIFHRFTQFKKIDHKILYDSFRKHNAEKFKKLSPAIFQFFFLFVSIRLTFDSLMQKYLTFRLKEFSINDDKKEN